MRTIDDIRNEMALAFGKEREALEAELHDAEEENFGAEGICTKCKEHTEIGNSCCGDDYVHIN